jgi:hypothetical protein
MKVFWLIVIGALVLGGLAFGGYTLIHNQAEKTACEQLADDSVYTVNPSHAWDLYEIYMAAPSGSASERTALNAVGSYCSDRGVSLSRASWYSGSESSSSSSSSSTTTSQPSSPTSQYGHPTSFQYNVVQGPGDALTLARVIESSTSLTWDDGSTAYVTDAIVEANTEPSSVTPYSWNANVTRSDGMRGSYWVSWSGSSSGGFHLYPRTH